ncbi:hypothetical protein [Micromonospora sp. NPDC048830]|uniref:hypothetical protein n=1 Tax=Micromonospora sp. NPDC048830 TaxID=3364257 RepID=UPI003717DF1B
MPDGVGASTQYGPRVRAIGAYLVGYQHLPYERACENTLAAVITVRVLLAVGSGAVTATALAGTARLPTARRPAPLAAFGACLAGFSATAPLAGAAATHWSWRTALVLPALSIAVIPLCWPLTVCLPPRERADWLGVGILAAVAAGLLLTAQTAAQQPSVAGAGNFIRAGPAVFS